MQVPAQQYTPSAPLEGKYARLIPYVRGHFPRGYLGDVWKVIEAEGAALDIFYSKLAYSPTSTPFDSRGDLEEFIAYFASPDRLLFHVEEKETSDFAGIMWLDEIIPNHKGTVNLFFRMAHRGKLAFEAAKLFRDFCTGPLGLFQLWGITPWKHSVAVGRWVGLRTIAKLPRFARVNGQYLDGYVLLYEVDHG